jgi:tetratricopeptide (TPR) repeat protein
MKTRVGRLTLIITCAGVGASIVLAAGSQVLKSAAEVLRATESGSTTAADGASPAAALSADITRYREQAAGLPPAESARRWFDLEARARQLGQPQYRGDVRVLDSATGYPVNANSMLAALPPPEQWPAWRAEAARRSGTPARGTRDLALRYLGELLVGDHEAAAATLTKIDAEVNRLPPERREGQRAVLLESRNLLARLYGSTDDQVAALGRALRSGASYGDVNIPDLVGLVGEQRAAEVLGDFVGTQLTLKVTAGAGTRKLVRRLALAGIDRMRVPQWELVDGVDAAPLYEAIARRFPDGGGADARDMYEYQKHTAALYYFLAMVRDGRQDAAEATLRDIAGSDRVYLPREAVDALLRARLNEPLYRFLDAQLSRQPELRAWDVYIEQAAYTGHGAEALALIERTLAREGLPGYLAAELRALRISALLAADRIDDAAADYRALLEKPPRRGDADLQQREEAALNAAAVGRLLGRKELAALGLDFARRAADLSEGEGAGIGNQKNLVAELRRQGFAAEAQAIALASLARKPANRDGFQALQPGDPANREALVEIAGIYHAAGRHEDLLKLLRESSRWSAGDLSELLTATDALDVPLGAMVAAALEATGDRDGALRVARATAGALPGRDAAYEIIARLDPDATNTFERMYAVDEYEERPLIWKAAVQLKKGELGDAEATARRAIAVDPSDGEEGPNDRMRVYAVLSGILARKGDARDADLYATAVAAIRLSERGDQLYYANLYERAFKTYDEALGKFSDAYCIQSRLAVQLVRQGRRQEALEHYRRAYELMPGSFGRVESHCFGCESVFQDPESQTIAEKVFTDLIRKSPGKAQAHYLLAYLREQQGDYAGAVQPLRAAVSIDPKYLNAWKRLQDIGDETFMDAGELDIARLKLLELDPLRRHSQYSLEEVGQLDALWRGAQRAHELSLQVAAPKSVFPLPGSAGVAQKAMDALPPEMRSQMEMMRALTERFQRNGAIAAPAVVLYRHALMNNVSMLLGNPQEMRY